MKKYKIELNDDGKSPRFVRGMVQEINAECKIIERTDKVEFQLEDEAAFRKILVDVLTVRYKYKTVFPRLRERQELPFYAYVGSVLSTEKEEERGAILQKTDRLDAVNVDGFYNFEMNTLRTAWESLGLLAERLYSQCRTEEDKTALITYMLQLDGGEQTVTVCGENLFGKEKLRMYEFFDGKKENFIANLLYERPSEIIVATPEKIDKEVFEFIARLSD